MLKVLGRATSGNVQKVLWLLDEMALPYEHENIGGPYGKNKDPEYLRLNPNAVVPTLIEDDFILWESNAILRYLASAHGGEQFFPADAKKRANVDKWMDWQASTLAPAIVPLFFGVIFEKRAPRDLPDAIKAGEAKLEILDQALAGQSFLANDTLSLAEMALGPMVYRWFHFEVGEKDLTNLRKWYDRLAVRPAYQKHVMTGVPNFTPPKR